MIRRTIRPLLLVSALAFASACGKNPDTAEKARGVLSGANLVLALSIVFIVVAVALAAGAIAFDRTVRARRALREASAAPEEEEEEVEVVAGIGVGRAPVPRWLYGLYVAIPLFAALYVLNAVSLAPPQAKAKATAAPTGPANAPTITASGIKFDKASMSVPANTSVKITIENKDAGVPHTFTIWKDAASASSGQNKLADTGQFTGVSTKVLAWKTPAAGKYYFDCVVHPSMNGSIDVVVK